MGKRVGRMVGVVGRRRLEMAPIAINKGTMSRRQAMRRLGMGHAMHGMWMAGIRRKLVFRLIVGNGIHDGEGD